MQSYVWIGRTEGGEAVCADETDSQPIIDRLVSNISFGMESDPFSIHIRRVWDFKQRATARLQSVVRESISLENLLATKTQLSNAVFDSDLRNGNCSFFVSAG